MITNHWLSYLDPRHWSISPLRHLTISGLIEQHSSDLAKLTIILGLQDSKKDR